ncbi:MAG TPA: aminotransferase class I/II-fold pyridoxal phosphate-dependent enzyme, partial [Gaiellaceae bacterium]|nr:aminotransferase class I/II-fold pyridoxal phosphate-dependent enzyme [Gaiellaceae bacterium]
PGVIPLAIPDVGEEEVALVGDAMRSGWVAYGPYVDRFESEIAELVGAKHAVGVGSGTFALHVALLLAGVQPDDEVLVSTLTFISPAFAIRYAGAWPVLMDAEPEYRQLDVEKLADFLREETTRAGGELRNRKTGRRIGAILPVGILGHPVDMDAVNELAAEYGVPVVEDGAETLGATYRDRPAGHLAPLACLSFNGNKLITSASGGMIVTDDDALAGRARYLIAQAKDDPLEYVHGEIGFNYRLSNLHAAFGVGQLHRLPEFVDAKRRIAERYEEGFADVPGIVTPREAPWAQSTFWLYTIEADESRALMRGLLDAGIQVRPLWQPLHESPALRGAQAYRCETAERLHRRGLSLPCSVSLTENDQARVIDEVRRLSS